ncbi:sigma-70 family RNA polymerase sigma factor [Mesobacillus maritimus]|uniref:sigma-70 family RNA polymerase sigma factor n=1 Tax=Mesobacillus maritimus TaxID=1643336 RepID=UPI003850C94E
MESFEQVQEQYTPMIHCIIRKLSIYTNKDEFFQIGLIALWEAHRRFNPEKGLFSNYAYTYIKGSMMQELTKRKKDEEHTFYADGEFFEVFEDSNEKLPDEESILLNICRQYQLTENQTKWVLYNVYKGLKNTKIASIENVSVSAVKAWRAGAIRKLKQDSLKDLSDWFE